MQLQELHIYSEKSSSDTKISIKNKDGKILFECCYSNDVIPTFVTILFSATPILSAVFQPIK